MSQAYRKKSEDQLLLDLACGASVEAAARKNRLSERTVHRRLAEPEFAQRVQALRADMVQRASGMLTAAAMEAVKTLLSLQDTKTPPPVRLGAARAILEVGVKMRELAELEGRLAELEQRMEVDKPRLAR